MPSVCVRSRTRYPCLDQRSRRRKQQERQANGGGKECKNGRQRFLAPHRLPAFAWNDGKKEKTQREQEQMRAPLPRRRISPGQAMRIERTGQESRLPEQQ